MLKNRSLTVLKRSLTVLKRILRILPICAHLATIAATLLLFYQVFINPQIDKLSGSVSKIDESLNRLIPERLPGADPFALKQGNAVKLAIPSGDTKYFTMGQLDALNSFAYARIDDAYRQLDDEYRQLDDEYRQLHVGKKIEFGPINAACTVQLVSIDDDRAEAIFSFNC